MGAPKKKARASARALNQAFEEEASPQAIELFGRLKAWRLEVSRQAGVPPFAVFTDQTLRDIAQAMPKNTTHAACHPRHRRRESAALRRPGSCARARRRGRRRRRRLS